MISSWSRYLPIDIRIRRRNINWTLASRIKSGAIFEIGETKFIPRSERFYAGGATTVRGYQEQLLGPTSLDNKGDLQALGGKFLFLTNVELRIPLFWLFVSEVFVDGGNVWEELNAFQYNDIRFSTGLGLAIITPLGPVRLDYGYKLNPQSKDKDHDAYHLGIYFAF